MVETLGFEGLGINIWLVWILPFVGAAIIAGVARVSNKSTNYAAVGFALASAISGSYKILVLYVVFYRINATHRIIRQLAYGLLWMGGCGTCVLCFDRILVL
jgi:hypothetical protein